MENAHDAAEGGFLVALAECCVSGRELLGARVRLPGEGDTALRAFGEGASVIVVSAKPENCTPERIELDQKMAKDLLEVTHWRRKNDIVEFVGPTTFRFRISTH